MAAGLATGAAVASRERFLQHGAAVAREAHNFEVAGSNPAPAPTFRRSPGMLDTDEPFTCSGAWCQAAIEMPEQAGC